MSWREILAVPAALGAKAVALDAGAAPAPASEPWPHAAIQERVAIVVAAFSPHARRRQHELAATSMAAYPSKKCE